MTTTLTARGPEDLLAAVPVVLGFHPEDSLVMLTFGAARSFHARLDLPPSADDEAVADAVEALLGPSLKHEVDHVAFVVYSGHAALAARLAVGLVPAFVAEGIGVIDVLRAHRGGWCSVPIRAGAEEPPLRPYDDRHHPFRAQAVFEGRVTHASREELRATLAPDVELRERWARRVTRLPRPGQEDVDRVRRLVGGWVTSGEMPDDGGAARVLRAVTRVDVRDATLYAVTRDTAQDHLRVWAALLRGAPDPQVPDVAAVTAFCAWQSGHGALAWCALDRCFELDERHRPGRCLAECLVRAVPPTAWEEVVDKPGPGTD
ncbi:MAG TPA: DUF4192 domain-containing protein [Nocardioides sp.]|nr:DUF4192 domain-containing protein [Nocardioides sp.]